MTLLRARPAVARPAKGQLGQRLSEKTKSAELVWDSWGQLGTYIVEQLGTYIVYALCAWASLASQSSDQNLASLTSSRLDVQWTSIGQRGQLLASDTADSQGQRGQHKTTVELEWQFLSARMVCLASLVSLASSEPVETGRFWEIPLGGLVLV